MQLLEENSKRTPTNQTDLKLFSESEINNVSRARKNLIEN